MSYCNLSPGQFENCRILLMDLTGHISVRKIRFTVDVQTYPREFGSLSQDIVSSHALYLLCTRKKTHYLLNVFRNETAISDELLKDLGERVEYFNIRLVNSQARDVHDTSRSER